MATTSIGADRGSSSLQRYPDATFVRDDTKFYLGDDGDMSFMFDGTNVLLGGAFTVALSDTLPATSGAIFLKSDTSNVSDYILVVRK